MIIYLSIDQNVRLKRLLINLFYYFSKLNNSF